MYTYSTYERFLVEIESIQTKRINPWLNLITLGELL